MESFVKDLNLAQDQWTTLIDAVSSDPKYLHQKPPYIADTFVISALVDCL